MKTVNPITGELIRKLSQHRGLRPGQLAGKLKLKGPQVSQIFSGQKKVDGSLAFELASILNVAAGDLINFAEAERNGEPMSADERFDQLFPKEPHVPSTRVFSAQSLREEFKRNSKRFCANSEDGNFFCIGSEDESGNFILPCIEGPTVVLTLSDAVWVDETKDNSKIDGLEIVLAKGDELNLYVNETVYLDENTCGRLEVHPDLSNSGLVCGQYMPVTLVSAREAIHLQLYVRNDVERPIVLRRSMPIFRFISLPASG